MKSENILSSESWAYIKKEFSCIGNFCPLECFYDSFPSKKEEEPI